MLLTRRHFTALAGVMALATSALAVQAVQAQDGTFVTVQANEPRGLVPTVVNDGPAHAIGNNFFSRLVAFDLGGTVYGDLADSWEVSDDFTTYTFHLNKDVTFHDGQPLTSADVKFTYDLVRQDPKFPGNPYLRTVTQIDTPDDHTVVMTLEKSDVAWLPMLALAGNWALAVLPKHLYEGTDVFTNPHNREPVGSGPFRFQEWQAGSYVSAVAYDEYFRGRPRADEVVVMIMPDPNVVLQAFTAGELDQLPYEYTPPYNELPRWEQTEGVSLNAPPFLYDRNISFNVTKPPFDDQRVRDAIALIVDREAINDVTLNGYWYPQYTAGIDAVPEYLNRDATFPLEPDIEKAMALLDEAGYPAGADGVRFSFDFFSTPYISDKLIAEALREQFRQVGIQANMSDMDWATWISRMQEGDWQASIDYVRYAPDPFNYNDLFATDGGRNYKGYSNPELDAILEAAVGETDSAKRHELYNQVQEILVHDKPYIVLFNAVNVDMTRNGWKGTPYDPDSYNKAVTWMGWYNLHREE